MKSADTRDMFAAAAMAAIVQCEGIKAYEQRFDIAEEAYEIAEAMMAERALWGSGVKRQEEQEIDAQRQMGVTI